MAELTLKREVAYQIHCKSCDNDTIHLEKADVLECSVCHVMELCYVIEREGRMKEVPPPVREKTSAEKLEDLQKAQKKAVSGK